MSIFISIIFSFIAITFVGKASDSKIDAKERVSYIQATVAMAALLIIVNVVLK